MSRIKATIEGGGEAPGPNVRDDYRQVDQHPKRNGADMAVIACTGPGALRHDSP
jgi:hypothetical protein